MGVETGTYVTEDWRILWYASSLKKWLSKKNALETEPLPCPGYVGAVTIYFVIDLHNKSSYKDKVHILYAPKIIYTSIFLRAGKKLHPLATTHPFLSKHLIKDKAFLWSLEPCANQLSWMGREVDFRVCDPINTHTHTRNTSNTASLSRLNSWVLLVPEHQHAAPDL